jgi:protocatechuate 3,4-dioxygenase beta subunit
MKNNIIIYVPLMTIVAALLMFYPSYSAAVECSPTGPDMLGPFYEAGAPERESVGKGYILNGVVRSSKDCSPVKGAKVELWLTGPDGEYDDHHRATLYSGNDGAYRFESNYPRDYFRRKPHIHIQVSAEGFGKLITQHYPEKDTKQGSFDLVLVPLD